MVNAAMLTYSRWMVLIIAVMVVPTPSFAQAAPVPPFKQCPAIGYSASCSVLIVINPNGSLRFFRDGAIPAYDDIEDTLVGVVNKSGSTVFGITLKGPDIFGFDGDGAADPTGSFWAAGSPYGAHVGGPYGPTMYEGPNTSFSKQDSDSGVVNFPGGLANNDETWFSLEGAPTDAFFSHTITVDPGHGNTAIGQCKKYTGATGPKYGDTERNLVLDIGLYLKGILEANGDRVVMTRTTTAQCPSGETRAHIANDEQTNIFVSIHFNGAKDPAARGTEVWYVPLPGGKQSSSKQLASEMYQEVSPMFFGGKPRGLKRSTIDSPWAGTGIPVLNGTVMASALVEVAFLSNPDDQDIIHAPLTLPVIAFRISVGIKDFFAQ